MKLDKGAIDKMVVQLNGVDLRKASISEIEEIVSLSLRGYRMIATIFNPELLIYRARVCSKPQKLSEIIYPEPKYVTRYGRANDIGKPIFYGGIGRAGPIAEIGATVGDTIMLSYWITTEKLILNHVGFSKETEDKLSSKRTLETVYDFVEKTKNFTDLNTFAYNFLASKFTINVENDEDYKYKLSIGITNMLLRPPFQGIMYPSMALKGNSDNIVLNPKYVDNHLKLVSVQFMKITKMSDDLSWSYDVLDTATEIEDDGTILWSGRSLAYNSNGTSYTAKSENGEWLYKDDSGNFIFPTCEGDVIANLTPLFRAFRAESDNKIKMTRDLPAKVAGQDIVMLISMVFDCDNRQKHIALYIPDCPDPIGAINFLIQNIATLTVFENDNIIECRDADGILISTTGDCQLENLIEIYSEVVLDESNLKASHQGLVLDFIYS